MARCCRLFLLTAAVYIGHLEPARPANDHLRINEVVCIECAASSARTSFARGWRAYLVDLDDDGQDEAVFYCPVCAEREFGIRRRSLEAERAGEADVE